MIVEFSQQIFEKYSYTKFHQNHSFWEQSCSMQSGRGTNRQTDRFFTFMWLWIVTDFFVIKPTRCTKFTNLFCHETLHVSDSSSVHHQEFIHCTLSNGTGRAKKKYHISNVYSIKTVKDTNNFIVTQERIGESRLLWGGFLIWGGALFHTRRCCALCWRR